MKAVLDAWAILAYLQKEEPASSRVKALFVQAESSQATIFASLINVGEVFYIIGKRKGLAAAEETLTELRRLPFRILTPSADTVLEAARLKVNHNLSYADAFAAVTARHLKATLLTGDPELLSLSGVVSIESLRMD